MKKYELTDEVKEVLGHKLHRIRALKDFGGVHKGELGGWVESEDNLSQEGTGWVYGDASVFSDARVYGDAMVYGDARVGDNAMVCGDARVGDNARVFGDASVYGKARVYGDASVYGDAWVGGDAFVYGNEAIFTITNIGSRNGTTTFFNRKDGKIGVKCGCFCGDIDEFAAAVKKTHGDNKFAKQYEAAIQLAQMKIHTKVLED